jgi:hypothetical protein
MASRYRIDPAKLTVVLTSCGRFDLLEETVASFLDHFDTDRIVIADDAAMPAQPPGSVQNSRKSRCA